MSFFATFVLVFLSIIRPQEIWPFLEPLHLLDIFTALAVLGVVYDLVLGRDKKYLYSPQLPFLLGLIVICYASTVKALGAEGLALATFKCVIAGVFMLVVMYGARTYARLRAIMMLLVALAVFVAGVAIHQGYQEAECIEFAPDADRDRALENGTGSSDGRSCQVTRECYKEGRGDVEYQCEKLGLFNTVTTGQRVRWRGQLGDPNELAVYIGAVIPFIFAMIGRTRRGRTIPLAVVIAGIGLWAVVLSKSRGGQLVVASTFGSYFVARYRWKGLLVGVVLALPMLFMGSGREDADASAEERTEILFNGMTYIAQHPTFGMGIDQFGDLAGHTAHNSYVLAAAEIGLPGFFFWSALVWSSVKIPLTVARRAPPTLDPAIRELAVSLVVSFIGLAIGIFFLSFTFKQLLFVWLGMCGALYGIVKSADPSFEVKVGRKDLLGLLAFDVVVLVTIYVYTRAKA